MSAFAGSNQGTRRDVLRGRDGTLLVSLSRPVPLAPPRPIRGHFGDIAGHFAR